VYDDIIAHLGLGQAGKGDFSGHAIKIDLGHTKKGVFPLDGLNFSRHRETHERLLQLLQFLFNVVLFSAHRKLTTTQY
jgi:hypothetical protein